VTPIQEQLEILRTEFPKATLATLPGGASLISVPGIALPTGWSKAETTVRFAAPVGYPFSPPDCFWADSDLRLVNNALPQNSAPNNPCPDGSQLLWFSWHVGQWNPNSDSLLTYLRVIRRRLDEAK
jgi:Prokaryotic E2 family E